MLHRQSTRCRRAFPAPTLLQHWHMAEFSRRHAAHQALDGVVFGAGLYIARHDLTDRFVQRRRSMLRERAHNIALRQDADNALIGAEDHDRA